jgi:hypothetical protein
MKSFAVFGTTTIRSTGPGVAVMDADADAVLPLTVAVMETVPLSVPRVMVVDAAPDASVVVELGDVVAWPVTVKFTVALETAAPDASATTTVIVPPDCPTSAELAGPVVIVTRAGGPILGATASDPRHAAANAPNAPSAAQRRRVAGVTSFAR